MDNNRIDRISVMFIMLAAISGMLFTSAYSQGMSNNSSAASNQSGGNNSSAKPIGSASQLMALLGNNAELIANGTSIGNPNASTAEKMATNESNAGGNQTGNQSGSPQQGSAGNQSGNQSNP